MGKPERETVKVYGHCPRKKLEWLQEMHDFICRALTKKQKHFYYRLKANR